MKLIIAQDVAFGHDVLGLVTSNHCTFLQDFDGVEMLVGITTGQQHFTETATAEHAQEFKIIWFQPKKCGNGSS